MDLNTALWSDLPLEMLEQVLSYLPVPDLCRYRTVCKRWDRLMCDPKFGSLCAQNAAKREASFIAMRYSTCGRRHEGWCFLDVNARRWYVVEDGQGICRNFPCQNVKIREGLVCQFDTGPDLLPSRTIVYNPISQSHREVTDDLTTSLSPFCTSSGSKLQGSRVICPDQRNLWSHVMFQGYLYNYFHFSSEEEHLLSRCNFVTNASENLDVPIAGVHHADLIVSANRLFLVAWSKGGGLGFDDGGPSWSFQLSELKISNKTREVLFEMSEGDVVERFETTTSLPT